MKLISQWKSFWRMWSIRFNAIGVALLGYIAVSPEIVLHAWNMLPMELKQVIPPNYMVWITVILFVLAMISRVVKQEKLPPGDKNGTN